VRIGAIARNYGCSWFVTDRRRGGLITSGAGHFSFAAAFFLAAHRLFIAVDSAFRPATVRPPLFAGTGAFGAVLSAAAATGAGASAAAFAALIAAQRFLVPAMIARLPAELIFRFTGMVGPTLAGGVEYCSTDGGTAIRLGPGGLPFRFGP
jgi:hypothetical protein